MAGEPIDGEPAWPNEHIPDTDDLYLRVHRRWLDQEGRLDVGCFRNHPEKSGGMSTDWSKYAEPDQTRRRALRSRPADNAIIGLNVGAVRAIPEQTVVHTPIQGDPDIPDNRAHTEVFGPKNARTRARFFEAHRLLISLDAD